MSWTTFSAGSLDDRVCCLIFAPVNVTMSQKLSLVQSANSVSRVLTADRHYIVGDSAASLENSFGVKARTVVVRALPDVEMAVMYLIIASPSGISTVTTTS